MTIQTIQPARGLYDLPADIRANAAEHRAKIDWDAPFQPGDDLRITTPIVKASLPRKERRHLADMDPVRRAALEAEWADGENAIPSCRDPISAEIKARAAAEWDSSDFIEHSREARRGA